MLEEKIEELKTNTDETSKAPSIQTQIDLMISASIPDSYFLSETDKLNFYREIELIESREDLEYLKNSFLENNTQDDIPLETQNLFLLLETQILAKKYKITHIKRV
jgi:transcription-repair coupling factor (superfamily II helicase)